MAVGRGAVGRYADDELALQHESIRGLTWRDNYMRRVTTKTKPATGMAVTNPVCIFRQQGWLWPYLSRDVAICATGMAVANPVGIFYLPTGLAVAIPVAHVFLGVLLSDVGSRSVQVESEYVEFVFS